MFDMCIIPSTSGLVNFELYGGSDDTGLMLLQRLYVMLLSDPQTGYRNSDGGQTLLKFLDGGNIPVDSIMDTYLALGCATAVSMLEESDSVTASRTCRSNNAISSLDGLPSKETPSPT